MCKPSLRRTKRRRLLSLALARARERMKGEGVGRTSMHDDRIHPHPALRAGLSLPGRGVPLLLRWEHAAAFCTLPQPSEPLSAPSGGGEGEGEVGDSTIARRRTASPYMPCVRQRALCQAPSRAPSGTGRRGGSRTALRRPAMSAMQTWQWAPACVRSFPGAPRCCGALVASPADSCKQQDCDGLP